MAGRIPADRLPPGANVAELAIAREHEISTNVGFGVAIPHARCPNLDCPLVVFARSRDGVIFDGQSSDPVHLLFLLITPAEQPDIQVLLLSQIARAAGNPETRKRLREAASAHDVGEILAAADAESPGSQPAEA
jgi:mannitol/fructose-specific phosphotransferase system IIA component (Ntr-type)